MPSRFSFRALEFGKCASCSEWIMEKKAFRTVRDNGALVPDPGAAFGWFRKDNYVECEFLMTCGPTCMKTHTKRGLRVAFEFEKFLRGKKAIDRDQEPTCIYEGGSKLKVDFCGQCAHEIRPYHHAWLYQAVLRGWESECRFLVEGKKRNGPCRHHAGNGNTKHRDCVLCTWEVLPGQWTPEQARQYVEDMKMHCIAARLN